MLGLKGLVNWQFYEMHWSSQQHHMGMTVDKNKGLIQLYLEN